MVRRKKGKTSETLIEKLKYYKIFLLIAPLSSLTGNVK